VIQCFVLQASRGRCGGDRVGRRERADGRLRSRYVVVLSSRARSSFWVTGHHPWSWGWRWASTKPLSIVLCLACYSRSDKYPTLQLLQQSFKSASTTPQRPIWNTLGTVAVTDFWENGCTPPFFEGMSICAASLWQPSICNSLGAGASTGKQPVAGRQIRGSFDVVVVPLISAGGWRCPQHSQPRAAASRRGSTIANTSWLLHYPALARPLRLRSGRPVVVA